MSTAPQFTIAELENGGLIIKNDSTVDLSKLDGRILLFMAAAGSVHQALFHRPLIITSGRDSAHAAFSKHSEGRAVDCGLQDLESDAVPVWLAVCWYICTRAGCGLFYEFAGTPEEHFHVETNS